MCENSQGASDPTVEDLAYTQCQNFSICTPGNWELLKILRSIGTVTTGCVYENDHPLEF